MAEGGIPKDFDQAIPAGTRVARFAVASDDPAADIDLEVYQLVEGALSLVGASGSPTGIETVTLVDPEPGNYVVRVLPFADPPGCSSTTFTLRNFVVGPNLGNFTVTPANATVTTNTPITLTASWSGLAPSTRYLGYHRLRRRQRDRGPDQLSAGESPQLSGELISQASRYERLLPSSIHLSSSYARAKAALRSFSPARAAYISR